MSSPAPASPVPASPETTSAEPASPEPAGAETTGSEEAVSCSFCLKTAAEVATLVAGPGVFICNECIQLAADLVANKPAVPPTMTSWENQISDDELLATLPKVAAAGEQAGRRLTRSVRMARDRGITWTRIGAALGMTRQSAWERFSGEE